MAKFSIQTITALSEVITGGAGNTKPSESIGIYRSGPTLQTWFGNLNLELNIGWSSRVPSVKALLTEVNQRYDGQKILIGVINAVVDVRDYFDCPEKLETVVQYLNKRLEHDGFQIKKIGKQYRLVSASTNAKVTQALITTVDTLSFESVKLDFERAIEEASSNPEGALTSACSSVESTCKCILDKLGQAYPTKQDISGLVRAVQQHLNLSPDRKDAEEDIRRILGGLGNVAGGIGALRTHAGDAHGRGSKSYRIDTRIARLAIHAASTISLFFIETWQERAK
ncbi:MAG: abortive infection family protein [Candidatus Omnitrophota bacterium]